MNLLTSRYTFLAALVFAGVLIITQYEGRPVSAPAPGYPRFDLPEQTYRTYNPPDCPFAFEYPAYAQIQPATQAGAGPCWTDIRFPTLNLTLHLTYSTYTSQEELVNLHRDTREFVNKHIQVASDMREKRIASTNVRGLLYEIGGNAATPFQFRLQDTTGHFVRGSMHWTINPHRDSLLPIIRHTRHDLQHLIETFRWK